MRTRPLAGVVGVALTVVSACAEPTGDGIVAQVGDWRLSQSDLAELLVLAQPYPLDRPAVEDLARHWIGAAAFAQAAGGGLSLSRPDALETSTWLEQREAILDAEREDRFGDLDVGSPEATFDEGRYRLLAHVLRRVGPETSLAERDLQRRAAERILQTLVGGGGWEAAVAESEDPETRDASGLIGLVSPGELPQALDRAAFALEPGQISSVVQSPQGFHILYRPRYDDVADLFASRLRERLMVEADAEANRTLLPERGAELGADGLTTVRGIVEDPLLAFDAALPVMTWPGGALELGVVARYVAALPSSSRAELLEARDEALTEFIEGLAVRAMRIADAAERGIELSPELVAELEGQHRDDVAYWSEALDVTERSGARRADLDRYMRDVVSRQVEVRTIPPLFEAWLLERVSWSLSKGALPGAVDQARSMLAGAEYQGSG